MSDARGSAEEALAFHDSAGACSGVACHCDCASALRALLAEPVASDEVREAAELRRVLSLYDEWNRGGCACEPAYCLHLAPLIGKLHRLAALSRDHAPDAE